LDYKEQEVSLLLKLGCLEEGEKLYRALLSMNPDNYRYFIDSLNVEIVKSIYPNALILKKSLLYDQILCF
jgi:hypothetical protein